MQNHRSNPIRPLIQALLTLATAAALTACGGRDLELPTPESPAAAFPTTSTTPEPTVAPADDAPTTPAIVDLSLG